jgi:mono/diheme cytochrome c family protein
MSRAKVARAAILSILGMVAACAGGVQSPRSALNQDPGALLFNGYAKADIECFQCHNGDGGGSGRGPNLGDRVPKLSDDQVMKAIDEGPGWMPAFKDKLNETEKKQLVAWLRARFRSN